MNESQNRDAVLLVSKCYTEAYNSRREQTRIENPFPGRFGELDEPWVYYQDAYDQRLWQYMGSNPAWKSRPTSSKPFTGVESYTTFLTDNRPRAEFTPVESNDYDDAMVVKTAFDFWNTKQNNDLTLALAVKDSRKFGVGWLHLRYDDKRKEQVLDVVHPQSVLVDPDCTADKYFNGEGPSYVVYEYLANLGDLKSAYSDIDFTEFNDKWTPWPANLTLVDRARKWFGKIGAVDNPSVTAPVYELWIRDEGVDFREEDLGEYVAVMEKKRYAKGRRIVVAGGIVLEDGENPYQHGEFPFTPVFAYPETGKFYCSGDIERILTSVIMDMKIQQLLYDSTVKAGGGIILTSPLAGLNANRVTNAPIQVLEVKDVQAALRVERMPTPPRHLFDMRGQGKADIDDTLGQHDISRGAMVPGNKTAQEIAALTESDKTRVRLAAKFLGFAVTRVGRQWLSNAGQFVDWEYLLRFSVDDETAESLSERGQMAPDNTISVKLTGKDLKKMGKFDISVVDSSSLPNYYQEKRQMAMDLFGAGVIDDEALLEALDWPNRKALLARKKALMQQNPAPEAPMPPEMGVPPAEMMPPDAMMGGGMPPEAMMGGGMPPDMGQQMPMMPPQGPPMEGLPVGGEVNPEILAAMMKILAMMPQEGGGDAVLG